jgi:DNA-directed RNA polymerase
MSNRLNLDERIRYIEANRENIIDSANNPLDGRGWWKEAEDPFQVWP